VLVVNDPEEPLRVGKKENTSIRSFVHISVLHASQAEHAPSHCKGIHSCLPAYTNYQSITVTRIDGNKNVTNGCDQWRRHYVYTIDHLQLQFRKTNLPPPPSLLNSMRCQLTNPPKSLGHILDWTNWLRVSLFDTSLIEILYVTWRLVSLSNGTAGGRNIIWFMLSLITAFLPAQPLNLLRSAYIPQFPIKLRIWLDGDLEITIFRCCRT
jgi:hypothetical protein